MKKIFFFVSLTLGVSLLTIVASFGWELVTQDRSEGRTPFTAHKITRMFDSDGIQKLTTIHTYAVRSDGSFVSLNQMSGSKVVGVKVILDTSSKKRVAVDPLTESITTHPISIGHLRLFTSRANSCTEAEATEAESGQFLGYHVQKEVKESEVSRTERWVAPALNCYPLKKTFTVIQNGVAGPHNESEIVAVIEGEPDPQLFEVPANFVERSPSEVLSEYERRNGIPAGSQITKAALDDAYFKQQNQ